MKIQVLGTGCPKCRKLEENVKGAIKQLGADYQVEKVTGIKDILSFGVMLTPALALNGQVVTVGKIPSVENLVEILGEELI
jgi:small redox-active disulfide protein 2